MPKRGQKAKITRTTKYKEMLEEVPTLCKSQVYNELYGKLRKDGRIDRFIAIVQYCSQSGLSLEETVKKISEMLPGYLNEEELTVDCFKEMLKMYSDVSIAWGWGTLGDDITQVQLKNRALSIINSSNGTMDDIQKYQEVFGKGTSNKSNEDNRVNFNFNLTQK